MTCYETIVEVQICEADGPPPAAVVAEPWDVQIEAD